MKNGREHGINRPDSQLSDRRAPGPCQVGKNGQDSFGLFMIRLQRPSIGGAPLSPDRSAPLGNTRLILVDLRWAYVIPVGPSVYFSGNPHYPRTAHWGIRGSFGSSQLAQVSPVGP